MTNREFSEKNELFKKCCELAHVEPTQRQASKFRMGRGLALVMKNAAKKELKPKETKNE